MPDWARGVFAARLPLAEQYAASLATEGVLRGLIGPREAPRLWPRHLLNSALLARALPETGTVCDIGSGAGLPGLVLAIARPGLQVTLVEPLLRRTTYLDEVVAELGLGNVEVVRGRAEDLHGSRTFDIVTSRAVAPLPRLLTWSMPLVAPGGAMVAMKGRSAEQELAEVAGTLHDQRVQGRVETVGDGEDAITLVRVSTSPERPVGWARSREGSSTGSRAGKRTRQRRRGRPGRPGRPGGSGTGSASRS